MRRLLSRLSRHLKGFSHRQTLERLRDALGFAPRVIYDIGAHHGNWTKAARRTLPSAEYVLVEANPDNASVLQTTGERYYIAALSEKDGVQRKFCGSQCQKAASSRRNARPGGLSETPWYDSAMKKRPDWPKLPGWKTFKGLQASGGFGTPPSVLRELMAQTRKRKQELAAQPPRSPARTARGPRSRAAK